MLRGQSFRAGEATPLPTGRGFRFERMMDPNTPDGSK